MLSGAGPPLLKLYLIPKSFVGPVFVYILVNFDSSSEVYSSQLMNESMKADLRDCDWQ